jgi:hypothetical protein
MLFYCASSGKSPGKKEIFNRSPLRDGLSTSIWHSELHKRALDSLTGTCTIFSQPPLTIYFYRRSA